MAIDNPTPEEIAAHYYRAGFSVALINQFVGTTDPEKLGDIERGVMHLEHMRNQPYWDGYDLSAWDAAIALGRNR
jgi:hypothetical protein